MLRQGADSTVECSMCHLEKPAATTRWFVSFGGTGVYRDGVLRALGEEVQSDDPRGAPYCASCIDELSGADSDE